MHLQHIGLLGRKPLVGLSEQFQPARDGALGARVDRADEEGPVQAFVRPPGFGALRDAWEIGAQFQALCGNLAQLLRPGRELVDRFYFHFTQRFLIHHRGTEDTENQKRK